MTSYKHLALFVGGVLFGSAGFKLLSSQDAKKAYTHATAAVLRAKDDLMETVTSVQENAADILASAKDLNEQRAAQETEVEDTSDEAAEPVEV
jgi:predicted  nucleic acid-binding Zn-ribbon protein